MLKSEKITSRDNSRLKFARSVRDGKEKGLIFIEGKRLAGEALSSDLPIRAAFVSESLISEKGGWELLRELKDITVVTSKAFGSIADTENSQGVVLIGERPQYTIEKHLNNRIRHLAIYLESINNPSNLGAVIRTAEAAGVDLLITSPGSADAFSPKSIRASMGSCFRLTILESIEPVVAVGWANENGIITTAADIRSATDYTQADLASKRLLIFGSEAHGLSETYLSVDDERIFIPMDNRVESLNLAVSVGIILFEAKRQRERIHSA